MSGEEGSEVPLHLYYLDEDFSPRSLRRYQLKAILKAHEVNVPSSSNKADMVALFQKHIASRRRRILANYRISEKERLEKEGANAAKSGHGLRSGKRVKKQQQQPESENKEPPVRDKDGFVIPPLPASRRKLKAARSNAMQDRQAIVAYKPADDDNDKLKPTPAFNAQDSFASSDEDDTIAARVRALRERRASLERQNVFRSLKQSLQHAVSPKRDEQQQEQQTNATDSPNVSEEEEESEDEEYVADSSDSGSSDEEDEDERVGEDELKGLIQDLQQQVRTPKEVMTSPNLPDRILNVGSAFMRVVNLLMWSLYLFLVLLAVASTLLVFVARSHNGYCDSGIREHADTNKSIFLSFPAACVPCPDHGHCVDGELICPPLYRRRRPLYNYFGLLPVADECILDSAIGRSVASAEKKIKHLLARRQGDEACNYVIKNGGLDPESQPLARTPVQQVIEAVKSDLKLKLEGDTLNEVITAALSSVLSDDTIHYWDIDGEPHLGTDRTKFSIRCIIQMLWFRTPLEWRRCIAGIIAAMPILFMIGYNFYWRMQMQRRTQEKLKRVIEILQQQLENHTRDSSVDRGCAVSRLRSEVTDATQPGSLEEWALVLKAVHRHPQIRRGFREEHGEPAEYWELAP